MSRLEKFINDNREEFDDAIPSEKVWKNIAGSVNKKNGKLIALSPLLKWTAAAVLIVATTIALLFLNKKTAPETAIAAGTDTTITDLLALAPEAAPEMNQFAKLIALKQDELKRIAREEPLLYQKFAKDIDQLDSSYNNLKNKLSVTPNREMLIEAMIQNLQLQLNVLNQQLNIIHQIKESKKNNHEKDKSFI
jgi:hypothetical protein